MLPDDGLFYLETEIVSTGTFKPLPECATAYAAGNIVFDSATNIFFDKGRDRELPISKEGRIYVKGKMVAAASLLLFLRDGIQYDGRIIHKDGDRANCRYENLVLVPRVAKGTVISHERLLDLLAYDPWTGLFKWRNNPSCLNEYAGYDLPKGYKGIKIDGVRYQLHRLAWFYHYGSWPIQYIDHIDGNPSNNAIANLRDVPMNINAQNKRTAPSNARTTKVLGVYQIKSGRFQAQIKKDKIWYNCGVHDTVEQAHDAYVVMKRKLHPGNML